MSKSIYKVEYECDCGIHFGSCGAKCAVILKSNNSVDVYTLYHTDSHGYKGNNEKPETKIGGLDCFGDAYLMALHKVIVMKEPNGNTLTQEERKVIFEQ